MVLANNTNVGRLVMNSKPAARKIRLIASDGLAYFPPSRLVPREKSGWLDDRISKGSFQLVQSGDDYDIIFTDASGGTLSSKGDGGRVSATYDESGNLLVLILYAGKTFESYVFWFAVKSERTVTYSQAQYGAAIVLKRSLMAATCTW
jgi:hypothetical protein